MPRYDFQSPRLFLDTSLAPEVEIALERGPTNYLVNVLRLKSGAAVLAFNGRDGEWRARLTLAGRKVTLAIDDQTRPQPPAGELSYMFAPLKHARLDYMVQKAVEMGAAQLQPVITRHTQVERINLERMRANAIEAAEQCGVLAIPEIAAPIKLEKLLGNWPPERLLVFCDEDAQVKDSVAALSAHAGARGPTALLIGPEGGFAEEERAALMRLPRVVQLALGPRILRADTAAVAAFALVQAVLGDWRQLS